MKRATAWKIVGAIGLAVVLTWAFMGYLHPDMLLNWEAVLAMCGWR